MVQAEHGHINRVMAAVLALTGPVNYTSVYESSTPGCSSTGVCCNSNAVTLQQNATVYTAYRLAVPKVYRSVLMPRVVACSGETALQHLAEPRPAVRGSTCLACRLFDLSITLQQGNSSAQSLVFHPWQASTPDANLSNVNATAVISTGGLTDNVSAANTQYRLFQNSSSARGTLDTVPSHL